MPFHVRRGVASMMHLLAEQFSRRFLSRFVVVETAYSLDELVIAIVMNLAVSLEEQIAGAIARPLPQDAAAPPPVV
jgi:hypothetical protein